MVVNVRKSVRELALQEAIEAGRLFSLAQEQTRRARSKLWSALYYLGKSESKAQVDTKQAFEDLLNVAWNRREARVTRAQAAFKLAMARHLLAPEQNPYPSYPAWMERVYGW